MQAVDVPGPPESYGYRLRKFLFQENSRSEPDLFKAACNMVLEGLVSKRRNSRYRSGPSRDWIKVKNPASPAMGMAKDAFG